MLPYDSSKIQSINDTYLALIPKCDNPKHISQFHLIALCNVTYKIIIKIIANRLKHFMNHLITYHQSSFIPSRHISNNITITQEVIHTMKN